MRSRRKKSLVPYVSIFLKPSRRLLLNADISSVLEIMIMLLFLQFTSNKLICFRL